MTSGQVSMRDGLSEGLCEIAKRDSRIVVLCADLAESIRLLEFKKLYPDRFFEMGIAEQNMMGVAAGMAAEGLIPFVASFAVFNPGRNWEQMRISVCLSRQNVKIIGAHAGFGNGGDGANQQAFEDIAITRVMPNLTVLVPADYAQAKQVPVEAVNCPGPVYIRISKEPGSIVTNGVIEGGRAYILRSGKDVTLVACGSMVEVALEVAELVEQKISVEVINVSSIKPFDNHVLIGSVKKTGKVVTIEEHSIVAGLGGAVAEVCGESWPVFVTRVGMPDCFGESGTVNELRRKYGMDVNSIAKTLVEAMSRRTR